MKTQTLFKIASLLLIVVVFSGCGSSDSKKAEDTQANQRTTEENTVVKDEKPGNDDNLAKDTAISNPATVYCLAQGGEFTMDKTLNGEGVGYCKLPNNITCEIWAYYKGECPEGAKEEIEEEEIDDEQSTSTSTDSTLKESEQETATSTSSPLNKEDDKDATNPSTSRPPTSDFPTSDSETIEVKTEPGEETGEIYMSWKTNLEAPDGYIVMLSGSDDITYPTKYFHRLENQYSHSFTWIDLNPEKTYYFRVCTVKDDECDTYSPVISGQAADK